MTLRWHRWASEHHVNNSFQSEQCRQSEELQVLANLRRLVWAVYRPAHFTARPLPALPVSLTELELFAGAMCDPIAHPDAGLPLQSRKHLEKYATAIVLHRV